MVESPFTTKTIRVLYVDDYSMDRELVREALSQEDIHLVEAATHAEFVEKLPVGNFDVVLSDFNILGVEGLDIIDHVRARFPDVPVVIVTGTGSEEVAVSAWRRGAADYVIKTPSHIRRLPITIRSVLEKKRLEIQHRADEQALRESENRFRSVIENSFDVITMFDATGTLTYVSPSVKRVLGYGPEELVGQQGPEIVHPDDVQEANDVFAQALEQSGQPISASHRLRHKDGSYRMVELTGVNLLDVPGVRAMVSNLRDVTERVRAERQLAESERRLNLALEAGRMGSWDWDLQTGEIVWSSGHFTLHGYQPDEVKLTYEEWASRVHPDDLPKIEQVVDRARRMQEDYRGDYRVIWPDGSTHWIEGRGRFVYDHEGQAQRMHGVVIDIDEKKEADERLQQSEAKLKSVLDTASILIASFDLQGNLTYVNRAIEDIAENEPIGTNVFQYVPEELHEGYRSALAQIQQAQAPASFEVKALGEGQKWAWYSCRVGPIVRNEKVTGFTACVTDITNNKNAETQRKRADEALRKSEEKFRTIVETSADWIWEMDLHGRHTFSNRRYEDILGYSPETIKEQEVFDLFHPEDRAAVEKQLPVLIKSQSGWKNWVVRFRHQDGSYRFLESNAVPMLDEHGKLVGYRGVDRDITDIRLTQSELLLRNEAIDTSVTPTAFGDNEFRIIYANRAFLDLFGLRSQQEVLGISNSCFQSEPTSVEKINASLINQGSWTGELATKKLDGTLIDVFCHASLLRDDSGNPTYSMVTFWDITDRKRAEQALKESEEKFRTLAENSPVIVAIYQGTTLVYTNRVAEKFTGYSRQELFQMASVDIVHPNDREMVLQRALRRQAGQPAPERYEFRLLTKTGEVRWVDFSATMIDYGGQPAVLSTAIDITQRKRSEAAIRGLHVITSDVSATLNEKVDRLLRLGCERFGLELAILGMVDGDRCRVDYLVAPDGFPIERGTEFELKHTFSALALEANAPVTIENVAHTHWVEHPLYKSTKIESFLGVPIHVTGQPIGAISFCDRQPRGTPFDDTDKDFAQLIARWVGYELERNGAERTLRDSEARLAHMSRVSTMGEMATALAHELSQPLGAAANYAGGCIGLVEAGKTQPDELLTPLRRLKEQINGSGEIIRRLRSFISKAAPNMCQFDLNEIAREVDTLLPAHGPYQQISRKLDLQPDLPRAWGDPLQVKQVLVNLVRNAMAAVAEARGLGGEVIVRSTVVEGLLTVSVIDNGTGVSAERLNQVFEPYYTTKPGGMGMGLAICRTIIQNHRGKIWVESKPQNGAHFCFTLPSAVKSDQMASSR